MSKGKDPRGKTGAVVWWTSSSPFVLLSSSEVEVRWMRVTEDWHS